jgi:anaerobic magnesium-protoporphyrin IX monomethyl ester cyclase
MAKALLILPHLPQKMGAPYLGQQYIAASLLAAGHEVRCLDMAAILYRGGTARAVAEAERFGPDLIGMTLFTYNALAAYNLLPALRATTRLLVAGGPHATVLPDECVAHGFDVAVSGEGERVIVAIARSLDATRNSRAAVLETVARLPGCWTSNGPGTPAPFLDELDDLPFPHLSYPSFTASDYSPLGIISAGGMMTSRGCPARCTFCANYVTGRGYRWRSTDNIIREMLELQELTTITNFPFWDDAFTARRPRLNELCDAIRATDALHGATWTCITPGNMVQPFDLDNMRDAGCVAVNFGLESGDYNVLKMIRKGQRPEQVRASVKAAKQAGMMTIVNFMFGFPGEDADALDRTLELMHELAEDTDFFNNRGVLVPFPGTSIYDEHVAHYDFERWWLDPARVIDEPDLHALGADGAQRALEHDPTLDLDFFRYPDAIRAKIAACVRFKAQHNQRTLARMSAQPNPVAA